LKKNDACLLHGITFSGWKKCDRHVACHSNGELPRVFSTLEWRATLVAGINWKIMMPSEKNGDRNYF
jgi:hypothetical protein